MTNPTVWITYAWVDNKNQDVDFIAQELRAAGLDVKLDRWNIQAGERLWEQIAHFIQDEQESDAWLLYATASSLGSEACREEFAYALDRAINNRGRDYPVIGLFPGPVDDLLIPAGIRARLYVSITDPDWKERIKAAAEGRGLNINIPQIEPYHFQVHTVQGGYAIEFRPRAGVWYPFVVGVPLDEKVSLGEHIYVLPGPPGGPPQLGRGFFVYCDGEGESTTNDGSRWWMIVPQGQATPTKSYYLFVKELPSRVAFGPKGGVLRWVPLSDS